MNRTIGNIWDLADSHWLVIPTNYGWRSDGSNVMGHGLAAQAARRFPELPALYGEVCRASAYSETADGSFAPLPLFVWRRDEQPGLILFVVKPLDKDAPHLSWRRNADCDCIRASCEMLREWMDRNHRPLVAMPMVGCGNGRLSSEDVLPIFEEYFSNYDNVVLVELEYTLLSSGWLRGIKGERRVG